MATISIQKHRIIQVDKNGGIYPEAASQNFKVGDLVYLVSGAVTACASDAVLCLGVAKTAATGITGSPITVEHLTGKVLEMNCKDGTDAAVTMIGNAYGIDVLSATGYEGVVNLDNTDTTNKIFLVVGLNQEDYALDTTPTCGRVKVTLMHGADQAAAPVAGSFTTLAASGNATIGGTLGVTGAVTLTAGMTVGTTLEVTGATTLTGAAAINETSTVATNKKIQFRDTGLFIHSSADGKLLISSDGSGADDITFSGTVTHDAAFAGVSATFSSTLGVTGATTLTGALVAKSTINHAATVTKNNMTLAVPLGAVANGQMVLFTCTDAPDGNTTLKVGDQAALYLYKGDRTTRVGSGHLVAGACYLAIYDAKVNSDAGGWYIPGLT